MCLWCQHGGREGIKRQRNGALGVSFEKGPHRGALAGLELTEVTCSLVLLACFSFPCLQACCDILLKGLPESPFPGSLVLLLFSLYSYLKTLMFCGRACA